MSEKQLVQFNSPKNLLEEFDEAWKEANFSDRTDALNHLMRAFIAQHRRTKETSKDELGRTGQTP